MSYVESKMVNAAGKMAKLLGTDAFLDGQGTSSPTIALDGFTSAVDDGGTYATYAGITRSDIATGDNVGINSYVATVPTLSLSAVQTAYGSCWFGNERVDLMPTTQAVWDILWSKIQPQQRFNEESSDVAKIGFQSLRYNGASVVVDQYAPTGVLWFLNTKYIQFWISTMRKYQFGQFEALLGSDPLENGGEFGGRCEANPEPSIAVVNAKARVETMGRPLVEQGEDIVHATGKNEPVEPMFTGWKEALKNVLGLFRSLCQSCVAPAVACA